MGVCSVDTRTGCGVLESIGLSQVSQIWPLIGQKRLFQASDWLSRVSPLRDYPDPDPSPASDMPEKKRDFHRYVT